MKRGKKMGKPAPDAPKNVKAAVQGRDIVVTTGGAARAELYEYFRRVGSEPFSIYARIPGTTLTDKAVEPNVAHSYKIRAYNSGGLSPFSAVASATVKVQIPPEEPPPNEEPEIPPPNEEEEEPPKEEEPPVDPEVPEEPQLPPPTDTVIPVNHAYQAEIYGFTQGLERTQFVLPSGVPTWDSFVPSLTKLAELHFTLSGPQNQVQNVVMPLDPSSLNEAAFPSVFACKPESFVLKGGLERDGVLHLARRVYPAAWWYSNSIPLSGGKEGNPFYKSPALALRVLVTVFGDMAFTDWWHGQKQNPWGISAWINADSRFLGGLMNGWAYAYMQCREVLPQNVRQAFEAGFIRMTNKLLNQKTGRNTPNMTSRVIPAMGILVNGAESAELKNLAVECAWNYTHVAKNGSLEENNDKNCLLYPYYVQEGFSPETTYQGVSLYHLTEAYCRSGWHPQFQAMLVEFLENAYDFRAHQLVPTQPNFNGAIGPSAYAGRTGAGYEGLQASHNWRDLSAAAIFEQALPFEGVTDQAVSGVLFDQARMVSKLKTVFSPTGRWNVSYWPKLNTAMSNPAAIEHDHHWPGYVPYFPPHGAWYQALFKLVAERDDKIILPNMREGYYFNRSYADDYWMVKAEDGQQDFGFMVETERNGGTYGGYRGGSLQSFWTELGGVCVLGRKNKDSGDWNDVLRWPTHHLAVRSAKGWASTSQQQRRDVRYVGGENIDKVFVDGPLIKDPTKSGDLENQQAPLDRRLGHSFERLRNGIYIVPMIQSMDGISEAWENFPILQTAVVEYFDGVWKTLDTAIVNTDAIRFGRVFSGSVSFSYYLFDKPVNVRLQSEWQQTYQGSSRIRSLNVSQMTKVGCKLVTQPH